MIESSQFKDVLVTISHPWTDIEMPLAEWAQRGPSKERPLMRIVSAKWASTGEAIALEDLPQEYLNTRRTRRMQREGLLPAPWGMPPEDRPLPKLEGAPPDVRERLIRGWEG
ncbi:hypothetical protein [Actinoplanes sp. DH11]|uniref:hypothetical protein n=1 Tax=Actinoplanes sp. DH11 TaxID=2857011 RepID=UPI001E64B4C1|nr:hypothetical protein [Actinoplanes sp. DH11]